MVEKQLRERLMSREPLSVDEKVLLREALLTKVLSPGEAIEAVDGNDKNVIINYYIIL